MFNQILVVGACQNLTKLLSLRPKRGPKLIYGILCCDEMPYKVRV